jgi:tetratricopeptide (TPR) repeat protein
MTDSKPDGSEAKAPRASCPWMQRGILAAMSALVIAVYAYTAHSGVPVSGSLSAADSYYNLLVQGFRDGQLSLKKEVPPGLAQLADPYDPTANALYRFAPYGLHDMSYYKGRLYMYFGVTPALILLWPYVALTGQFLSYGQVGVTFCAIGFVASAYLLYSLWRRYFAQVSVWVVAAATLALGLVTGVPVMLARCDVYEVSISCAYALTMLALAAIWNALHESRRRSGWLAAGSLAYGLAVGARPNLLFGAVILLVPVAQAWREQRKFWTALLAAVVPIALIGCGLMLYNALRFDSPFEFGLRYQLAGDRQSTRQFFSLRYLWFNFRMYFLELASWSTRFPFVREVQTVAGGTNGLVNWARVPPMPAGYAGCGGTFGVLTNIPLVWLALAAPLGWRGRSAEGRSSLGKFLVAAAMLFGLGALTLCPLIFAEGRYEVDFLPALVLLAAIGILGLERALAPTSESGQADRPLWRWGARGCWSLLLVFSLAFNLLASVARCADSDFNLASATDRLGNLQGAIEQYQRALRLKPDFATAQNNLASDLLRMGKVREAMAHYRQALQIEPRYADAHYNLAVVLNSSGRTPEAIEQYEQVLRINPDHAEAHNNLGAALAQLGRVQEAMEHWEQALRINPDYAEAHYNLGLTLEKLGRMQEAIRYYEQALRINPDFTQAQHALARARAVQ